VRTNATGRELTSERYDYLMNQQQLSRPEERLFWRDDAVPMLPPQGTTPGSSAASVPAQGIVPGAPPSMVPPQGAPGGVPAPAVPPAAQPASPR
jgi:hypothetical protein